MVAGGAAIFKAAEDTNAFTKSVTMATHAPYYRLMKEDGSAQFRYWLVNNKHEHKKMLAFFNIQNDNKMVKSGTKLILDKVEVNQVIYVPMLAKVFDMNESDSYIGLTDEKIEALKA